MTAVITILLCLRSSRVCLTDEVESLTAARKAALSGSEVRLLALPVRCVLCVLCVLAMARSRCCYVP